MAVPLLLRGVPLLLRLRRPHHGLAAGLFVPPCQPHCTAAEPSKPDENGSSAKQTTDALSSRDPPQYPRWNHPDFREWKDREAEILLDIKPITLLVKEILHSKRYWAGERLTAEDEKAVVEKLLAYHPHSEDKIGCGLDSIVVGRHPQFRYSRCLFVVRTDGGLIDFSYQKCLQAYIREKYPSDADSFICEHFNRGVSLS
ncbi:protein DCL homolog, chloroplastic [Malania oleifera]|uniref:protein DCL homolog, chloroplastic n=1 Tax=Malania oleifera TaxID=397392 RepID=UPI0025AEB21C|nr:protein DCL homolog, chloroplastic [Malania oleifera]